MLGKRITAVGLVSCLAVSAGSAGPAVAATGGWQVYGTGVSGQANLTSVVAPARDDAWAAGFTVALSGSSTAGSAECIDIGTFDSLMLHWNGRAWQRVSVPDIGRINSLTEAGAADVWASGDCGLVHWNGERWSVVPYAVPPGAEQPSNGAIVADGPHDAWLLGSTYDVETNSMGAFAEHWDGHRWNLVRLPDLGSQFSLDAVDARGPDDVWIAGTDYTGDVQKPALPEQIILLHWNGREWTRSQSPATGDATNRVTGVQILGPDDVWVVGWGKAGADYAQDRVPLALHWTGGRWTSTPVPSGPGELYATARVDGDQWAVGDTYSPAEPTFAMDLLRRTRAGWVSAEVPEPGPGSLSGLAPIPGGGMWVVGGADASGGLLPVIARED
jgi:hypothetical protein